MIDENPDKDNVNNFLGGFKMKILDWSSAACISVIAGIIICCVIDSYVPVIIGIAIGAACYYMHTKN